MANSIRAMLDSLRNQEPESIEMGFSRSLGVNCTTCHRGELKPALNLPVAAAKPGILTLRVVAVSGTCSRRCNIDRRSK